MSFSDSWNSDTDDESDMEPSETYMPNFDDVEVNDMHDPNKIELDGTYDDWNFNNVPQPPHIRPCLKRRRERIFYCNELSCNLWRDGH